MNLNSSTIQPAFTCYIKYSLITGFETLVCVKQDAPFPFSEEDLQTHTVKELCMELATRLENINELFTFIELTQSLEDACSCIESLVSIGIATAVKQYEKTISQDDITERIELYSDSSEGEQLLTSIYFTLCKSFDTALVQTFYQDMILFGIRLIKESSEVEIFGPMGHAMKN